MKHFFLKSLLFGIFSLWSIKAAAYDCVVDGIYYNLDTTAKTASVTYQDYLVEGDFYFDGYRYYSVYNGSVTIPSSISYNGTTYSVTSIGNYAFSNCRRLTSISIPYSVNSIGKYAFLDCSGLQKVNIDDIAAWCGIDFFITEDEYWAEHAFEATTVISSNNPLYYAKHLYLNNQLVTDLEIPNTVTSIKSYAFYNATDISSVTIHNSVTNISGSAFKNCRSLQKVNIDDIAAWCRIDFYVTTDEYYNSDLEDYYTVVSTNNPLYYAKHLYLNNQLVTNLEIPNSVTNIPSAFCNAVDISSVTISNSVTNIDNSAFTGCSGLKNVEIYSNAFGTCFSNNNSIQKIALGEQVTSIASNAFKDCSGLEEISISANLTSIGSSAFTNCNSLQKVNINDIGTWCKIDFSNNTDNPLYYAKHLYLNNQIVTNLEIPNTVTSIKPNAFYNASDISSVAIPNSVTSIDNSAFAGCSGLKSVEINTNTIGTWFSSNFQSVQKISLGEQVSSIASNAFNGCSGLTEITIPSSVTSIGSSAFENCSSLQKVNIDDIAAWCRIDFGNNTANPLYYAKHLYLNNQLITNLEIPNSITSIKPYAFYNAIDISNVSLPNFVTSINKYAFSGCSGLNSINIPANVTSMGSSAFQNCSSLQKVSIDDIAAWCRIDFANNTASPLYYAKHLYLNNQLVTNLEIPNTVNKIKPYAFYNASDISSVTIPNSVTSIDNSVFTGCIGLKNVEINMNTIGACFSNNSSIQKITFGEQVTSIGSNAFKGCTGLTEITIPASVSSIGSAAFSGCTNLSDITSEITDVFVTGTNAFEGCENATLHVPAGTFVAYSGRADWNRIVHIEESASSTALQMILACNTKGSVLINDETRFTNKIGDVEVKEDVENTFIFIPNDGCKLEQVTLNGLDVISSVNNNRLVARIPADSQMNVVFSKQGDMNSDGRIDISDVVSLVNLILGQ